MTGPTGFFGGGMLDKAEKYANPFYGIPQQYLPLNMDSMLWWSDHFLLRFGFYRAVLARIANYFITELNIECDNTDARKQYEKAFNQIRWKQVLANGGLNLLAYGNVFASINRGFIRMLVCPQCQKMTNIDKINDYKFQGSSGTYSMRCKHCGHNGKHEVTDKISKDTEKINISFWNPREVVVRYEPTSGHYEYYWNIPPSYAKQVTKNDNKFYSKKTPKVVFDAVYHKKAVLFNKENFVHLRVPMPAGSVRTDGRSIPFCIYLFDDFFILKVLQRYNEAICFEDINPFRVIAMSPDMSPAANPILTQSSEQWRGAVQQMIRDHRKDPGSYHTFPYPLHYEQLGGKGKMLAPVELINQAIMNILNALSIPQELYTMNLQTQALGPALRLFENSWSFLIDCYNELLQKMANVIAATRGLPTAKVNLIRVTLSDDVERKSIISQLVASNSIARSELLKLFGFDYEEQIRKRIEENRTDQDLQRKEMIRQQLQDATDFGGSGNASGSSPNDVLQQAEELAQQLFQMSPQDRRKHLQDIKAQNETLWAATKGKLEQLTSGARSQGLNQAKQQGQQ